MIGKSVYLLTFLVSIAVIANAVPKPYVENLAANITNRSHHLIVGARLPGDVLVLKESVIKTSSWMKIVTVEQVFSVRNYGRITQVRALDQKINGNGATATLLRGGPGVNNVTLRFKSIRGHGINFVVELYARHY